MAQKKHSGWERKRVRRIQDKLIKRAGRKPVEKPSPDSPPSPPPALSADSATVAQGAGETAREAETPPQ